MIYFSRKLVAIIVVIFAQSSLGTNALQSSGQRFWTKWNMLSLVVGY